MTTYQIAMAAGLDEGNRSMLRAGRSEWNENDWNEAAAAFSRIMGRPGAPHERTIRACAGFRDGRMIWRDLPVRKKRPA